MLLNYGEIITRLRRRISHMLPRDLVNYCYEQDPDFILLMSIANNPHNAQLKYYNFTIAAHGAYKTARMTFLDTEEMYVAAATPFRVLAQTAKSKCR